MYAVQVKRDRRRNLFERSAIPAPDPGNGAELLDVIAA